MAGIVAEVVKEVLGISQVNVRLPHKESSDIIHFWEQACSHLGFPKPSTPEEASEAFYEKTASLQTERPWGTPLEKLDFVASFLFDRVLSKAVRAYLDRHR